MQGEENLVQRAQNLDTQAFSELYEEYFAKIYRYLVIRLGNEMEAEDLAQQVFLNALKSISTFKWKGAPFSAWLYRIAHNLAIDYLRKRKKQNMCELNPFIPSSSNPQMELERKMDVEQLVQATGQLTEAQQQVISLRFGSELPIAQVARIMGKSEGAVKALQHSAIVALRKMLVGVEDGQKIC